MRIRVLILSVLLASVSLNAQVRTSMFSGYLNLGQAIPMASLGQNIKAAAFGENANFGLTFHLNEWIGLAWGASYVSFLSDHEAIASQYDGPGVKISSYNGNMSMLKLKTGINPRFIYGRFALESRLTLGYYSLSSGDLEVYIGDLNNEIAETYIFNYTEKGHLSFDGGFHSSFQIVQKDYFKMGIHFFSELSYQRPNIITNETYSNKAEELISESTYESRQDLLYLYYGFGLMLKF